MSLTQEQFDKDIAEHVLTILKEDGVYRHIRCQVPGTMMEHFDIITWPGYLCYTGDMGTYVFTRTTDMLEFFRRPDHCRYSIDMRYWAEKVEAGDRHGRGGGILEFSKEKFDKRVWEVVNEFVDEQLEGATEEDEHRPGKLELCKRAMNDLKAEVRSSVIGADDNDVRAYDAANQFAFSHVDSAAWMEYFGGGGVFNFQDAWEWDNRDFTHRFKWCCLALNWMVQTYDRFKERQAAIQALSDDIIFELKAATVELRWDEPGTETVGGYTLRELEVEMTHRRMKCSGCGTTENLDRDLGSGGPYRCNSPDCVMY